jgi:vacuolar protein-sorting-associated protein 4
MFFVRTPSDNWVPCGPKQQGAVQITMQELAAQGLASKVLPDSLDMINCFVYLFSADL